MKIHEKNILRDKATFEHWYITMGYTLEDMSKKFNVSRVTLRIWRKKFGIPMQKAIGHRSGSWKNGKGRYQSKCIDCGKDILTRPGDHRCKKCDGIWRSKVFSGKNHSQYKGLANVADILRRWAAKNWVLKVFARDKYTCCNCGDNRGGNLEAHHLISVSSILGNAKVDSGIDTSTSEGREKLAMLIIDSEVFKSINNGITLCMDCHAAVHGRKPR